MSGLGDVTPHISRDERLSRLSRGTMSLQELWGVECQKLGYAAASSGRVAFTRGIEQGGMGVTQWRPVTTLLYSLLLPFSSE